MITDLKKDRHLVAILIAQLPQEWKWLVGCSMAHAGFSPLLWPSDGDLRMAELLHEAYRPGGWIERKKEEDRAANR